MLLKDLCMTHAVAGNEKPLRDLLLSYFKDAGMEPKIDRIGNLIVSNDVDSDLHIAITAHMDEVGLMVKGVDESGLIRFFPVGGMDPRILVSKVVEIGENRIKGVIGAKPIHLQKAPERDKAFTIDQLYIDIGTNSKKETENLVSPGDYINFISEYREFGDHKVKAKALDNRVGCWMTMEMLKLETDVRITGIFTVQEELGLRGSAVAANNLDADLVLVLEGTTCGDATDVEDHLKTTELGKGPAISIMDRTSIYQKSHVKDLIRVANQHEIPWQYRRNSFGGNDGGRFQYAKEGTSVLSLATPCRYIHSPVSVMDTRDFNHMKDLLIRFIEDRSKGGR